MEQRSVNIFIANSVMGEAERSSIARKGTPGRHEGHSCCLILAMLGVKHMFGTSYRKTVEMFRNAGYVNLPDFRTLQWRSEKLKRDKVRMRLSIAKSKSGNMLLIREGRGDAQVDVRNISTAAWSAELRNLKRKFAEVML